MDAEIEQLRSGQAQSTRAPSSIASDAPRPCQNAGSGWGAPTVPRSQRVIVVVGGFAADSARGEIETAARQLSHGIPGIESAYPVGRRPSVCKFRFHTNAALWSFMRSMKGRRMEWKGKQLWHAIEKSEEERLMARKTGILLGHLRRASSLAPEEFRVRYPDPDYDRGIIFVRDPAAASGVSRLFQVPRGGRFWEYDARVWRVTGIDEQQENNSPVAWIAEANAASI